MCAWVPALKLKLSWLKRYLVLERGCGTILLSEKNLYLQPCYLVKKKCCGIEAESYERWAAAHRQPTVYSLPRFCHKIPLFSKLKRKHARENNSSSQARQDQLYSFCSSFWFPLSSDLRRCGMHHPLQMPSSKFAPLSFWTKQRCGR